MGAAVFLPFLFIPCKHPSSGLQHAANKASEAPLFLNILSKFQLKTFFAIIYVIFGYFITGRIKL